MIISTKIYSEIISKIQSHKGHCRELESSLAVEYGIPKYTILSIISHETKRKMKKAHYKINSISSKLYERYTALKSEEGDSGVMLKIADEINISYILLAKVLLEKYYEQDNSTSNGNKSLNVKQYLKDSTLIDEPELAYEVFMCQLYDTQYGNINDVIRQKLRLTKEDLQFTLVEYLIDDLFEEINNIDPVKNVASIRIELLSLNSLGQEYEYYLQKVVKDKNLTFQSECDLRIYGYDKTPDIKLGIPFAVDGFIVNWIESKALFADPEEHQTYMKDQYSSYWNRFGTGLVIYWLGMVDSVIDPLEKRFIVRDDFPQDITLPDPLLIAKVSTGLIAESGEKNKNDEFLKKEQVLGS